MSDLTITDVRPQHAVVDLPSVRRVDARGARYYYHLDGEDVTLLPSVTTILRETMPTPPWIMKWWCDLGYDEAKAVMRQKAAYGTWLHILCSHLMSSGRLDLDAVDLMTAGYVQNEGYTFDTSSWAYELKRDLLAFAQFLADRKVRVIAIEAPLASAELGYAGTLDLVCELKFGTGRVIAIVDIKSGRNGLHADYPIQLHAYRALWNAVRPDMPVEMVFNWAPTDWRKEPKYELTNQTDGTGAQEWRHLLALYQIRAQGPKPYMRVSGEITVGAPLTGCYRSVDVIEHIRERHAVDAVLQ